ncbi:MAG: HD-GYP domain-containing protein [Actinobacteria bacterium ATB1]|nr:HD-GYP domain-containing protein [Actinobacteria bacterium ATB1]
MVLARPGRGTAGSAPAQSLGPLPARLGRSAVRAVCRPRSSLRTGSRRPDDGPGSRVCHGTRLRRRHERPAPGRGHDPLSPLDLARHALRLRGALRGVVARVWSDRELRRAEPLAHARLLPGARDRSSRSCRGRHPRPDLGRALGPSLRVRRPRPRSPGHGQRSSRAGGEAGRCPRPPRHGLRDRQRCGCGDGRGRRRPAQLGPCRAPRLPRWAHGERLVGDLSEAAEALLRAAGAANEGPQHNQRVIQLAIGTAQELDLPPGRLRVIVLGALFHDVGTLAIPDEILNKPGALTEAERQLIESHVETGYAMASRVHLLWEAALAVRHHHEWWDGSGYPDGLSGDAIPIEARVIAAADMFDALTKPRPYREALTTDDALMMMRVEAGTHLDPDVFAAFSRYLRSSDNVLTFPMAEAES